MFVYRYHKLATHFLVILSVFLSVVCEIDQYTGNGIGRRVFEDDAVTLKCPLIPIDSNNVAWTRNNNVIKHSKRIYQIDGDLHIVNANRHLDAGIYICITRTSDSGTEDHYSMPISLEILWLKSAKIVFEPPINPKNVVLKCHIEGSGLVELEWYKDNKILEQSSHFEQNADKLVIWNPTTNDNGSYHCAVRNEKKVVNSESINVFIDDQDETQTKERLKCSQWRLNSIPGNLVKVGKDGRVITRSLRRIHENRIELLCRSKRDGEERNEIISVESDNPIVLNCNIKKNHLKPGMEVHWRKDGKIYRDIEIAPSVAGYPIDGQGSRDLGDGHSRVHLNNKNGSIIISSAILADHGLYECSAYDMGQLMSTHRFRLDVIEVLKFAPVPTSKHIELGTTGKMHCKVQGTPTPSVRWIKEPNQLLPDSTDDINGTLHFRNVTFEDSGNYTCIANNSQGVIKATVVITAGTSPKFAVQPEDLIVANEMRPAMIHCLAVGDPTPTIQWDKDLEYITANNTDFKRITVLPNGTLQFREVHLEDEGVYGCTIGNSAGLKREEARLKIKDTDDAATFEEIEDEGFVITRAVYITVSVVFAYIILVFGLMIWCRIRRKAKKAQIQLLDKEANENNTGGNDHTNDDEVAPCLSSAKKKPRKEHNGVIKATATNGKIHIDGAQKSDDTAASNHSKISKKSNFDQITIPRAILFDVIQIGHGEFGDVMSAKIKGSDLKNVNHVNLTVTNENEDSKFKNSLNDIHEIRQDTEDADGTKFALIKALNKVKDEVVCIEFRRQIEMFRAIAHPNVVHLFGLCRDKDPHYLVLEHTDLGDLKQFILTEANKSRLKIEQILSIAQQIARGMDAIYRARYIHKDVAARNCVVSHNFSVKVSYPALNKDKYSNEYYKFKNLSVPLRWMAPECLEIDEHTIKSDVYSFGVLIWELLNTGDQLPEYSLTNEEFLSNMQNGKLTRSTPDGTPDKLKAILNSCWSTSQKDRPSFSSIYSSLSKVLDAK